jgi:ParB-like chromosome segregation protein Spo0J
MKNLLNTYETEIPVEDLIFTESPSGEMNEEEFSFFKNILQQMGMAYKIIVIPSPEKPGKYEIVDGRHRAKALMESGATSVECMVLNEPYEFAYVVSHVVEACRKHLSPEKLASLIRKTKETFKEYNFFLEKSIFYNLKNTFDKKLAEEVLEEIKKFRSAPDYLTRLKKIKLLTEKLQNADPLLLKPLQNFYKSQITRLVESKSSNLPPVPSSPSEAKQIQKKYTEELAQKQKQIQELTRELEEKKKLLQEKETELETIKKNFLKIKEEIEQRVREELVNELNLTDLDNLDNLDEEKITSLLNENLQNEVFQLKKELKQLQKDYVQRTKELNQQKKETETLKEHIKKLEKEIKHYEREKERLSEEKENLTKTLENFTAFETLFSSLNFLTSVLLEIQTKLNLLESLPAELLQKLLPIFERAEKVWGKFFEGVQRAMIQAG